jgi:hypothetical protein
MFLEKMIQLLRLNLNDEQRVGWPDDAEIVAFLDRGASFLSDRLIAMQDPALMKRVDINEGGGELPADWIAFVGKIPVRVVGTHYEPYGRFAVEPGKMRWKTANIPDDKSGVTWRDTTAGDGPSGTAQPQDWNDLLTTSGMTALYWSRLPFPSACGPEVELPYTQEQSSLLIALGGMFALNKNEYDLTQDLNIMAQIQQSMATARGVANA